jgi:hypothetical protein
MQYAHLVGQRVCKRRSGKPFKSGEKVNTVKAVILSDMNPHKPGSEWCTFLEDESQVEAHKLEVVE